MFQLSVQDTHPGQQTGNREEVIRQVVVALASAGNVVDGHVNGTPTCEQQTSTFLGNGIAIPHDTTNTRDQVLETGVQVLQFPQGITWGEGQTAYVVIGITTGSDRHLGLLHQLTHVLNDDAVATQLQSIVTTEELRALLMGEKRGGALKLDNETLSLDVAASDLLTLQALNAAQLEEVSTADTAFVSRAINDTPLNLGQGVWLNDSAEGSLRSVTAVSHAISTFTRDDQPVSLLITVVMVDEQLTAVLNRLNKLLLDKRADRLLKADAATMLALLTSDGAIVENALSTEFAIHNEHSLHVRPGTMLVNTIKRLSSDVTVTNLDGPGKSANSCSLMEVIVLDVKKDHRLRFTVQGEDVQQALDVIGEAVAADLGEDT